MKRAYTVACQNEEISTTNEHERTRRKDKDKLPIRVHSCPFVVGLFVNKPDKRGLILAPGRCRNSQAKTPALRWTHSEIGAPARDGDLVSVEGISA